MTADEKNKGPKIFFLKIEITYLDTDEPNWLSKGNTFYRSKGASRRCQLPK